MWCIPWGSLSLYLQDGGKSNQTGPSSKELNQVGPSIEELNQAGPSIEELTPAESSFEELTQVDLLLNNEVTDRSV